jgi:4-hydroxythreonine-4-phosphate dehydrogenase
LAAPTARPRIYRISQRHKIIQRPLAITAGEPAGIGPDLCLQLASHEQPLVVIADKALLQQRAAQLGIDVQLFDYTAAKPHVSGKLSVQHVPLVHPAQPGKLDAANAAYVLETLRRALQGCQSSEFSGMVTAPVHKGIINDAGIPFTGHTEFLAEQTNTPLVVMMLAGGGMRVALATTHLPLREVADSITAPTCNAVSASHDRASWWPDSIRMPVKAAISDTKKSR